MPSRSRRVLLTVSTVLLLAGCGSVTPSSAADPSPTAPSPGRPAPTPPSAAPSTVAPSTVPTSTVPATTAPAATPARPAPVTPPPLASQPVPPPPTFTVVLDPGHNGGNAGAPGVIDAPVPDGTGGTKACNTTGTATDAGYPEHAFAWDVSLRVRDRLTAAGVRVVLTRPDDTGVGPCVDARAAVAAQVGAALFVGVHGDGAPASGRGFHVITSSRDPAGAAVATATDRLAADVRDSLRAVEPVSDYLGSDGLDARGDLAGLNLNTVPAVYVECGNMRNTSDAAWMSAATGRQRVADRLAAGILTYLGS